MRIYLAGKITGTTWRQDLFDNDLPALPVDGVASGFPLTPDAIEICGESFDYVGPYMVDLAGKESIEEPSTHGMMGDPDGLGQALDIPWKHAGDDWMIQRRVATECYRALVSADVVFAWIAESDIPATLVEIGMAITLNKPVWVGFSEDFDSSDFWFLKTLIPTCIERKTPREALDELGDRWMWLALQTLPYDEYLETFHWSCVRSRALSYAENRCQVCFSDQSLHVHHRTYEYRGRERPADVTVLCKECHETFHRPANGKPTRMPVKKTA